MPGTNVVVGDGPCLLRLRTRFPHVVFTGTLRSDELAAAYAGANVLVFPSCTDTFGLVMLGSLACGTAVAAFPVRGPLDVLPPGAGAMHPNLAEAVRQALALDRGTCRAAVEAHAWSGLRSQFPPTPGAAALPRAARLAPAWFRRPRLTRPA